MSKVDKDAIKKVAELAKLTFTESELENISGEFNQIIEYVSQVQACDVSGIDEQHNLDAYADKVLEEDQVRDTQTSSTDLLQNATDGRQKNGYIVVKGKNIAEE
jgi:aspartyl-tRNA(Asn)/glutamyl-tRNA(Gln) amidotransferase subunit C